jgi:hypothetical protein
MNSSSVIAVNRANSPAYSPTTPCYEAGVHSDSAQPGAAESPRHYECQPCSPCFEPGVHAHSDSADCDEESVQNYRPTSPVANRPVANQPSEPKFDTAVLKTELGKRAIGWIKTFNAVESEYKRAWKHRKAPRYVYDEDIADGEDEDAEKEWIEGEPQTRGGRYAQVSMQSRIEEAWGNLHTMEILVSVAKAELKTVDPECVLDTGAH